MEGEDEELGDEDQLEGDSGVEEDDDEVEGEEEEEEGAEKTVVSQNLSFWATMYRTRSGAR